MKNTEIDIFSLPLSGRQLHTEHTVFFTKCQFPHKKRKGKKGFEVVMSSLSLRNCQLFCI